MSIREASDYIDGLSRRSRQYWEMTRFAANVVAMVNVGKDTGLKFSWDKEAKEDLPTEQELADLREMAKRMEKQSLT